MESRKHNSLTDTTFWNVKMASVALCVALIFLTQTCPNPEIKGVVVGEDGGFSFEDPECSLEGGCACAQTYQPICFDDEVTYFSPCHAGCVDWMAKEADREEMGINSTVCACWDGDVVQPTDGICGSQVCSGMGLSMLILWIFFFFTFANNTTVQIILMRSVATADSAFSLSVHGFFWNCMDIPGTWILGKLFDEACVIWDAGTCTRDGSCAVFEVSGLTTAWSFYYGVCGKLVSLCFMLWAWKVTKGSPLGDKKYDAKK
jgi:hypothetical protein